MTKNKTLKKPSIENQSDISGFLTRFYSENYQSIEKVNIVIYEKGQLASDENYKIYKAKLEIETEDHIYPINWERCMMSGYKISRTVYYFFINAICSGLHERIYINGNHVTDLFKLMDLVMDEMPYHQQELTGSFYSTLFTEALSSGRKAEVIRKQYGVKKALLYSSEEYMKLYQIAIQLDSNFKHKKKQDQSFLDILKETVSSIL
ncbi:MAG: hypothetical protein CFH44_00101 [Proteobacteria bacterium]|nr:MAG: hypothetical protein CFH44_00101 [Pseudomonadota bacterium]